MKNKLHIILLFTAFFCSKLVVSQSFESRLNFDFFFDNTEFNRSNLTDDQTMSGINFSPEIGVRLMDNHSVFGGVNIRKQFGSQKNMYNVNFIGYYEYEDKNNLFKAGVFRKNELLDNFDDQFLQDSIQFFRPTLQGFFYQRNEEKYRANVWLDWTGMQAEDVREAFVVGFYGNKTIPKNFYTKIQGLVFHYANNSRGDFGVVDNASGELSIGYKQSIGLTNIDLSSGVLASYENDRLLEGYHTPWGVIFDADISYKNFFCENRLYAGKKRLALYPHYTNQVYWGNPFYRSNFYFQNKIYWQFIKNEYISGQIASKIHFSEKNLFFEQLLTIRANIDIRKK